MPLDIPSAKGAAREQAILELVRQGNFEIEWATITSSYGGHTAEFQVFADALQIEGVRVNVSADTGQQIADLLDCSLLTPKLSDLMWEQRAVTLKPHLVRPYAETLEAMIAHSKMVDDELEALGNPEGLKCTVGKNWVIANELLKRRGYAMNYGWYFEGQTFQGQGFGITASALKTPEGKLVRMIQDKGTRHDKNHTDYSQVCVLVSLNCTVDGNPMRLQDVLQHPQLSFLANVDGYLSVLRQT